MMNNGKYKTVLGPGNKVYNLREWSPGNIHEKNCLSAIKLRFSNMCDSAIQDSSQYAVDDLLIPKHLPEDWHS